MKATPYKSSKRKWHRGKAATSPEAGFFRDCGSPLARGENLYDGFQRLAEVAPIKMISKVASSKAVSLLQSAKKCDRQEAIMEIYSEMRNGRGNSKDMFEGWNPREGGLIPYLRRGSELASTNLVARLERSPWGVTVSLETKIADEDAAIYLKDAIPDERSEPADRIVSRQDMLDLLQANLQAINEDEREVISLFYGLNGNEALTMKDVSARLNRGERTCWNIKTDALAKLRRRLAS